MEAQNPQMIGSSVKYRLQTQSLNLISERQSKKDFQEDGKCLSVRKCGIGCGDIQRGQQLETRWPTVGHRGGQWAS